MYTEEILLGIFALINIIAFFTMANDKRKSLQRGEGERTPEGVLFFLAGAFGAGGIYLAMLVFRHKTRTWYFQIGIPILILQNLLSLLVIRDLFSS